MKMHKLPLWAKAALGLAVFLLSQSATVLIKEKPIREERSATQQQVATVQTAGRTITLHGLNAACFKTAVQRAQNEDFWLQTPAGNIRLNDEYRLISGSLKPPQNTSVCKRVRNIEGTQS